MLTLRLHSLIHPLIPGIILSARHSGQTRIHNFDQTFHTSTEDTTKTESSIADIILNSKQHCQMSNYSHNVMIFQKNVLLH